MKASHAHAAEATVYDGRDLRGWIKPVAGGFEAFAIGPDDEPIYIAKAPSRQEAVALIHDAHAARADGARQMQERKGTSI